MKQKMTVAEKREAKWAYLFVFPTMLGLIVLNFYPFFNTIYQSFCKT
ncbi:MAG TPA: sugar ABC transporter permease, partial [Lachnospiraceae bacterium]|nr:sugar ABC transporter permease [Lachnospiraceae bacterium]